MAFGGEHGVRIGLSAVVMALRDPPRGGRLCVLTTGAGEATALPFGPFDPAHDRTFELSLRAFVTAQTGFRPASSNSSTPSATRAARAPAPRRAPTASARSRSAIWP
jgi:hypothetical protein